MSPLAESLNRYREAITKYLYIGYANWDNLIGRIAKQEARQAKPVHNFADEQVWTFLIGCGYAMAGEEGIRVLTKVLTGSEQTMPAIRKIWFEVLPIPPRKGEGNTHIDLALGAITSRGKTKAGIKLDNVESSWVCFCEMKWYSDIALNVSHDIHRNQLARVIENTLCLQEFGRCAEKVYATLVTPRDFQPPCVKSRLYQYKFEEYNMRPRTHLINDLKGCNLKENHQPDWSYPSALIQRIDSLSLRWVNYDELFEQHLPASDIKSELDMFWKQNKY